MFSDLACPWCYVGQRRLDAALAGMPGVAAQREWRAFLLDPNYPLPAGEPIQQALARKFGPNGPALMQRIRDAGRGDGAAFGDWQWRSNTVRGLSRDPACACAVCRADRPLTRWIDAVPALCRRLPMQRTCSWLWRGGMARATRPTCCSSERGVSTCRD